MSIFLTSRRKVRQLGMKGFALALPRLVVGRFKEYFREWRRNWVERDFDRAYGVETASWVRPDRLDIGAVIAQHASGYEPTPLSAFRSVLEQALECLGIEPAEFTFVDLGAGKGRTLIMAAECGFRKLVGVEISSALCESARRNLAVFGRSSGRSMEYDVIDCDARHYSFPPGNLLIYLYHPFDEDVMRTVVGNLVQTVERRRARRCFVLYYNPVCQSVFESSGAFTAVQNGAKHILYVDRDRTGYR